MNDDNVDHSGAFILNLFIYMYENVYMCIEKRQALLLDYTTQFSICAYKEDALSVFNIHPLCDSENHTQTATVDAVVFTCMYVCV